MKDSKDLESGYGLFTPGCLVWVACPKEVWRAGVVSKVNDYSITVKVNNVVDEMTLEEVSEEVIINLCSNNKSNLEKDQLFIRATEQLSDYGVVTPDDLCELTHLHQPSILHAINSRFDLDKIYTFTGPILIAVNPYRRINDYYSIEMINKFLSKKCSDIPHVFNVANKAFQGVNNERRSQTILISGESGAGKTETTKFVLQFLTIAGSKNSRYDKNENSYVEEQIIQSNPLLEAFGNSQTLRNNNSSRFGKFIEVQFTDCNDLDFKNVQITSACINTYLLEKVRVCFQQKGERNFHIFYQICSAAKYLLNSNSINGKELIYRFPSHNTESILFSKDSSINSFCNFYKSNIREQLFSNPMEIDLSYITSEKQFRYLENSNSFDSDLEQFERTLYAIRTMGITNEQFYNIIKVIKAILFIGNITFIDDNETAIIDKNSLEDLNIAALFLSIESDDLISILCNKKILLREGEILKELNKKEAETTRDALSKALYHHIFDYIVYLVNNEISKNGNSKISENNEYLYCGVLDIFGFECFPHNSFEQLCINFANERLQQIFNDYIFNIEQDLYIQENISWDPIDFPDNADCVQLLQQLKPTLGIFPAIDEECFVPQGSNSGLLNKLIKDYNTKNKRFEIIKRKPDCFVIVHYAGPVSYCIDGFIEKNKDQLSQYSVDLLSNSRNNWICDLLKTNYKIESLNNLNNSSKSKKQTLGSSFREQLNKLISTIKLTNPHFIRCIKPNNNNSPDEFDRISVSEQLKYGGVLQAIQVSRAGYPVRFPHLEFLLDYMILFSPCGQLKIKKSHLDYKVWCKNIFSNRSENENDKIMRKNLIEELMNDLNESKLISRDKNVIQWAVGISRVFLKIETFRDLEQLRIKVRDTASTYIQGVWRMICCVKERKKIVRCAILIQSIWKGIISRRIYKKMLREKAAIKVQTYYRGYLARQKLKKMQICSRLIQLRWRRYLEKKKDEEIRFLFKICRIQATFRMFLQRKYYESLIKSVIKAQILWRGKLARRQFQKLKEERNEFSQLFAKYQEALIEIQKMKSNCSKLEDQLYKALSEKNKLKDERELLNNELNKYKNEIKIIESAQSENSQTNNSFLNSNQDNKELSRQKELVRRLIRISSYPFSKLGLLESIPNILFPQDSQSIVLNYQDRQIGLLFTGTSSSGDKLLLKHFLDSTNTGSIDENHLQVFTMELSNIPGAHVLLTHEQNKSNYNVYGNYENVRESNIGEKWPLNIMSITKLESEDIFQQVETFLIRTRVAIFIYDASNYDSFKCLVNNHNGEDNILLKSIHNGCKVVLFGNLYNVIHNLAKIEVDIEQVRRLSCELDIITLESDSISSLIYSIVGILNVRNHNDLKNSGVLDEANNKDKFSQEKQFNNSLLAKFNDGIRAFGLKIPKFPINRHIFDKNEFLIPTLDIDEASDHKIIDKMGGIGPVINIRDEQNSSVTHIVFCRDIPTEPYVMLLVARKNGMIHAYHCYKTKYENMNNENSSLEWSGRVEEVYSRKAHNRAITSLALSPDESEFLSTSIDMTVRRFLTSTGHAISLFSDNSPVLVGSYLPFLPSLFIVSSSKPLLRIVNVDVGVAQKIKTDSTIRALCFDSTGIYCFAACKEGRIYVLVNVAIKSNSRSSVETDFRFTDKRGMQVCSRAITNMLYVHGSSDYSSIRRNQINGSISNLGIGVYNTLLPVLVVNAADSTITIIDIRLQAPTGQIDVSNVPHVVLQVRFRVSNPHSLMPLRSCFTSNNGIWIASAAEDSTVRVFQLNNESYEKENTILTGHSAPVISTAVNASNTTLASGDADGVVILWRRFSKFER